MWVAFRWIRRFAALSVFLVMISINVASLTIASFNALISGAIATVSGVQTVAAKAQMRAAKLANTNKGLERKMSAQADELINLRKTSLTPAKQAKFRTLTNNIKARTARVAIANSGSVVGEAVPVFGIAVILGATAFELHAACETMKETVELENLIGEGAQGVEGDYEICGLQYDLPDTSEVWQQIKDSPQAAYQSAIDAYSEIEDFEFNWPEVSWSEAKTWMLDFMSSAGGVAGAGFNWAAEKAGDAGEAIGGAAVDSYHWGKSWFSQSDANSSPTEP